MKHTYTIHSGHEAPRTIVATGKRLNMILSELLAARDKGITSIAYPGVRVADSIFKARALGFVIETEYESHTGPFAGVHGRYRLRDRGESAPVTAAAERGDMAATAVQVPA